MLAAVEFGFSGIVATITCGFFQMRYTFPNLGIDSRTTIRSVVKTVATGFEIFIFLCLGALTSNIDLADTWLFALLVLGIIYVSRFFVTVGVTAIINRFTRRQVITFDWQVVIIVMLQYNIML